MSDFASLVSPADAETVKVKIKERYGDTVSSRYCSDLIAFVRAFVDKPMGGIQIESLDDSAGLTGE